MIPQQTIVLLSGIPACGKSHFAAHLAAKDGFVHYDLECYPTGWPCQDLHSVWDESRADFVGQLRERHQRVVLDWGFPPEFQSWVDELRSHGVRLIWLDGNVACAREKFIARGCGSVEAFERQVEKILRAGYPKSLGCEIIVTLPTGGTFMTEAEIEQRMFR